MSTFYLVRHGVRLNRLEDTELSDIGKKQTELTAEYLSDKGIYAIFASPLKRAQQTASIISQRLNLKVVSDNRLKERLIYGDILGISFEEFLKEWDKTSVDREYRPPVGDSARMSGYRIKSLIEEIDAVNKTFLIVTHGGIIGDFLRNMFPENMLPFQTNPSSSIRYVEILECPITIVEKNENEYLLKGVNNTGHLPLPIV